MNAGRIEPQMTQIDADAFLKFSSYRILEQLFPRDLTPSVTNDDHEDRQYINSRLPTLAERT